MTSRILLFCTFYADNKRNSNFRIFSRNIHFEVKYLENGLADYSDTYIILFSISKLFHKRATCIFFVVAL